MDDDYFSIDAILAENQKVPCTFSQAIPDMGHLAGGSERDIAVDSKIQIPLWLVRLILYSNWAECAIPPPFVLRVRNALRADSRSVRLSSLVGAGGLWYGFGKDIMDILTEDQGKEISQMLKKTFEERLVELVDQAQHFAVLGPSVGGGGGGASADSAQAFREGFDATERELFVMAQESAKRTKQWYEESNRPRR